VKRAIKKGGKREDGGEGEVTRSSLKLLELSALQYKRESFWRGE